MLIIKTKLTQPINEYLPPVSVTWSWGESLDIRILDLTS